MSFNQLGVIGLGTMGANLARNAAKCGAKVAVYNRTTETMEIFMKLHRSDGQFVACKDLESLASSLDAPRAILIMVKAGEAVDAILHDLLPHLSKGDTVVDGGNSHYSDTQRRFDDLKVKEIHFIGLGVSGGEEGALRGPSLMPGGDEVAYRAIEPLLTAMAADDGAGGKCVSYLGKGGAGHFVKMVHNGIEYAVMQLIAESYHMLKTLGGYSNKELQETFEAWSRTHELNSYLMEITAKIFAKRDDKGGGDDLIDSIKDAAAQKGTGQWTTEAAFDLGVAVPTITAAVEARVLSGSEELRRRSRDLPVATDPTEPEPRSEKFRSFVKSSLELSILCAYMQGFELLKVASDAFGWKVNVSECARIWRGGCIIRSDRLKLWQDAYGADRNKAEAATQAIRERFVGERQVEWRMLLELSFSRGIPTPALSASLNYYDAIRLARLPQNLIQAQRDFFGAHTFERTDKKGTFHADWAA